MSKKLQICLQPEIRYECWTYQRMAIIRAYPEFNNWFVHHLNNLYITSEYDCDFGWFGKKYNIVGHYEDILEIDERLYRDYDETSIISEICRRIDAHTYTIIDIDSSKIYKHFQETFVVQFLIYGYDDEKRVFYTPSPNGGWHEEEISWEDFIEAFKVRKAFTREQKEALEQKQHEYYNRVNNIIDYANKNRDSLVINGAQKQLDCLIGQLFDRTAFEERMTYAFY